MIWFHRILYHTTSAESIWNVISNTGFPISTFSIHVSIYIYILNAILMPYHKINVQGNLDIRFLHTSCLQHINRWNVVQEVQSYFSCVSTYHCKFFHHWWGWIHHYMNMWRNLRRYCKSADNYDCLLNTHLHLNGKRQHWNMCRVKRQIYREETEWLDQCNTIAGLSITG